MSRVLYLWQGVYPWEIRVEKFCLALRDAGHEVTLLARWKRGQAAEEDCEGVRVVRVGRGLPQAASLPIPQNPVWTSAIRRAIRDRRIDLVLAREIMLAEPAAGECKRRNIPLVIDMAEHYPATMRALKKYQRGLWRFLVFKLRMPDRVEARAVSQADGLITVCEEQVERLESMFGYPRDRMAVVHNTPDLATFDPVRKGSDFPPRVLAYHGILTAQRGLDQLIRGFAQVAERNPQVRLELAGDGESHDELVKLAGECGVGDRVRFLGKYRFSELVRLYSETDVGLVIYPVEESINHTLGNKIFDYLACGKPVVVSPAAPLRRVVEETGGGIVLDDFGAESIARGLNEILALDPTTFCRRGLEATRSKYNWEADRKVLLDFVAQSLSSRSEANLSASSMA